MPLKYLQGIDFSKIAWDVHLLRFSVHDAESDNCINITLKYSTPGNFKVQTPGIINHVQIRIS